MAHISAEQMETKPSEHGLDTDRCSYDPKQDVQIIGSSHDVGDEQQDVDPGVCGYRLPHTSGSKHLVDMGHRPHTSYAPIVRMRW